MATNPMQRKARNSFLLGMLLMLVILGAVIALLVIQLMNMKKEKDEEIAAMVRVYVLSQSVTSGQIITTDMLTELTVNKSTVPANATSDVITFQSYSLQDEQGNQVITEYENGEPQLYIERDGERYELFQEGSNYYIEVEDEKEYITLSEAPLIAKVDMQANTVMTTDLISVGEILEDSTRKQEYNMFVLPADLETGDYVDIRLQFSSGADYIVVSKKQVEIPLIAGIESTDTISIELSEAEINTLSNAIVDAFRAKGAKLYVNKYIEPGLQEASTPTYPVNYEVMDLINSNPNIVQEAREALWLRYNNSVQRNDVINPAVQTEEAKTNYETSMEESITNSTTTRKEYLEGLSAQTTTTTTAE